MGLVFVLAGVILETIQGTANASDGVKTAWDILQWIFRLLPHYNLGKGLYNIAQNEALGARFQMSPWSLDIIGWELIFLAWQGPVFFIATLSIEYGGAGAVLWFFRQLIPGGAFPICPPCMICLKPMAKVRNRMLFYQYQYHGMVPPNTNTMSNDGEDEDVALERDRLDTRQDRG